MLGSRFDARHQPPLRSLLYLESVLRDAPSTFNYCQLDDFPRARTEAILSFATRKFFEKGTPIILLLANSNYLSRLGIAVI